MAVVAAVVGKFDQAADIDMVAVDGFADDLGFLCQVCIGLGVIHGDERQQLPVGQGALRCQSVDEGSHGASSVKM